MKRKIVCGTDVDSLVSTRLSELTPEDIESLPEYFTVKLYYGADRVKFRVINHTTLELALKNGYVDKAFYGWESYTHEAIIVSRQMVEQYYDTQIKDETTRLNRLKREFASQCIE